MVAQETEVQSVDPSLIGKMELAGSELPYVDLIEWPSISSRLDVDGTVYAFGRSFPARGHSAIMPGYVAELIAQGRKILVVERSERYYVYVA